MLLRFLVYAFVYFINNGCRVLRHELSAPSVFGHLDLCKRMCSGQGQLSTRKAARIFVRQSSRFPLNHPHLHAAGAGACPALRAVFTQHRHAGDLPRHNRPIQSFPRSKDREPAAAAIDAWAINHHGIALIAAT